MLEEKSELMCTLLRIAVVENNQLTTIFIFKTLMK